MSSDESLRRQQTYLDGMTASDLGIGQSCARSTSTSNGKSSIQLRRVISNSKFPDNAEVIYEYPNPMSFEPRQYGVYREVTHIVLSSFGSFYDSQSLNKGQKVIAGSEVRIPNTEADQGYYSSNRVWSGIRSVVINPSKKLSGAHFYIDRLGNLIVMGDVDMAMMGPVPCSSSALFVALEESIYVPTSEWYKMRPTPRAILSGDARNVVSDGYTEAQYDTLAVLLRKLEMAFPELVGGGSSSNFTAVVNRAVSIPLADRDGLAVKKIAAAEIPGYITDAWPNFTTEEEWQDLFENYVDPQEQITDDDVWKSPLPLAMPWLDTIPSTTPDSDSSNATKALSRITGILSNLGDSEESALERQNEIRVIEDQISHANQVAELTAEPTGLEYNITEEEYREDPTTCGDWEAS